jgi:hypothetical protein
MSCVTKTMIGIGIVILSAFVRSLIAGPVRDAGARQIWSAYAADEGLVLIEHKAAPHSVPAFSCRFTDPTSTVIVDENDHLIELDYRYRGDGIGGSPSWALGILLTPP